MNTKEVPTEWCYAPKKTQPKKTPTKPLPTRVLFSDLKQKEEKEFI